MKGTMKATQLWEKLKFTFALSYTNTLWIHRRPSLHCVILCFGFIGVFPQRGLEGFLADFHEQQKSHSRREVRETMRGEEEGTSAHPSVLEPKLGQSLLLLLRPSGTAAMTASTVFMCVSVFFACKSICARVSLLYSTMKGNVTARHKLTNCAESSPPPHPPPQSGSVNISPFCSTHVEEPATSITTRLFHLIMWGKRKSRGEERYGRRGKKQREIFGLEQPEPHQG